MNFKLLTLIGFLVSTGVTYAQTAESIADKVASHWLDLHHDFRDTADVWGNYTLDLTLEALLYYDDFLQQDHYIRKVAEVFNKRQIQASDTINYRSQPFCSINFSWGLLTDNPAWFPAYNLETYRMRQEAVKSPEGAVMLRHQGEHRIIIDYLQEYASRLAKTAYLTQDTALFSESVNQFLIYEPIVRDKNTGLWSQGRGWCSDSTLVSEGAWSRGHGWLLRGMVTSMQYLPEEKQSALLPSLQRVAQALLQVQDNNGMYHILLRLPHDASVPDVSGTGMIAYYMSLAVQNGWLDEKVYKKSILSATQGLKKYVTEGGQVLNSSKGPGPLCEQDEYINYQPEVDEKHGFQGVIYGMLAEMMMRD